MSKPAAFYVHWFNDCGCLLCVEPANSIEEARTIISHWVPNLDVGDTIRIEENQ